jgi:acetyl esterase
MKKSFWAAVVALTGMGLFAAPAKVQMEGARAEVYKTASGDELKLYFFEPGNHQPGGAARPAIVFFFGGGWTSGTPSQFEQHARYLSKRGMVAAVADYRVKSRQGTPPSDCVRDGKSAVRYLRLHAKRLGIDPKRIAAGGGSAGGHVAAATGMIEGFDEESEDRTVSSKPNALVLFNPVYDNGPGEYGHDRVSDYWRTFSPAHNITRDDPPAIVFLGTKDSLIPVGTGERFRDRMKAVGLRSELHLYARQAHGFFNESKGGTEIFLDTLRKMDRFLVGEGFLEGTTDEALVRSVSKGKN